MFTFRPGTHRQILVCRTTDEGVEAYRFELSSASFRDDICQAKLIFLALRKKYVSKFPLSEEGDADLSHCLSVARDWLIDQGYVEQG